MGVSLKESGGLYLPAVPRLPLSTAVSGLVGGEMGLFCKSSQQESGLYAGLWNQVPCWILERYISACHAIFYLNKDHLLSWGQTND